MMRVSVAACALLVARVAAADQVSACADAAERAQTLRDKNQLREARRDLRMCAQESCPAAVRRDCIGWLEELDALQPSIVVHARDSRGRDVAGVSVAIDGEPVASKLDGAPMRADPGRHLVTLVARSGARTEADVLLVSGEKVRVIDARFSTPLRADGSAESAANAPSPKSEPGVPRWIGWGLGGVSAVSLALGAVVEVGAVHDWRAMRDGCAHTSSCSASDVDSARARLWYAAPILFGVGVVTGALAAWVLLARGGPSSAP